MAQKIIQQGFRAKAIAILNNHVNLNDKNKSFTALFPNYKNIYF